MVVARTPVLVAALVSSGNLVCEAAEGKEENVMTESERKMTAANLSLAIMRAITQSLHAATQQMASGSSYPLRLRLEEIENELRLEIESSLP
jgi:hypothetical protein